MPEALRPAPHLVTGVPYRGAASSLQGGDLAKFRDMDVGLYAGGAQADSLARLPASPAPRARSSPPPWLHARSGHRGGVRLSGRSRPVQHALVRHARPPLCRGLLRGADTPPVSVGGPRTPPIPPPQPGSDSAALRSRLHCAAVAQRILEVRRPTWPGGIQVALDKPPPEGIADLGPFDVVSCQACPGRLCYCPLPVRLSARMPIPSVAPLPVAPPLRAPVCTALRVQHARACAAGAAKCQVFYCQHLICNPRLASDRLHISSRFKSRLHTSVCSLPRLFSPSVRCCDPAGPFSAQPPMRTCW